MHARAKLARAFLRKLRNCEPVAGLFELEALSPAGVLLKGVSIGLVFIG